MLFRSVSVNEEVGQPRSLKDEIFPIQVTAAEVEESEFGQSVGVEKARNVRKFSGRFCVPWPFNHEHDGLDLGPNRRISWRRHEGEYFCEFLRGCLNMKMPNPSVDTPILEYTTGIPAVSV